MFSNNYSFYSLYGLINEAALYGLLIINEAALYGLLIRFVEGFIDFL